MSATYIHTEKSSSAIRLLGRFASIAYWLALAAAIAYLWVVAWDQFVSTSTFIVSREDQSSLSSSINPLLTHGVNFTSFTDAQLAISYINSSDLLLDLEKEFDLRTHYSQPSRDLVFRLEPDAPLEDRLEFYRKQITTHFVLEFG